MFYAIFYVNLPRSCVATDDNSYDILARVYNEYTFVKYDLSPDYMHHKHCDEICLVVTLSKSYLFNRITINTVLTYVRKKQSSWYFLVFNLPAPTSFKLI